MTNAEMELVVLKAEVLDIIVAQTQVRNEMQRLEDLKNDKMKLLQQKSDQQLSEKAARQPLMVPPLKSVDPRAESTGA